MNKTSAVIVVLLMTLISCFSVALEDDAPESTGKSAEGSDILALQRTEPHYPEVATTQGLEGYVVVEFDVSSAGTAENVAVVESAPSAVFDEAAREAVGHWLFLPKYREGRARTASGVRTKLSFELGKTPAVSLSDDRVASIQQEGVESVEVLSQLVHHYTDREHYGEAKAALFRYLSRDRAVALPALQPVLAMLRWSDKDSTQFAEMMDVLKARAASRSDGNGYALLAALYESRNNWPAAQLSLAKAFEKGRLSHTQAVQFILARVLYHTDQLAEARTVLESSIAAQGSSPQLEQWLTRVEKEMDRRGHLSQHLIQAAFNSQ